MTLSLSDERMDSISDEHADDLAASIVRIRFINGLDVETVAEIHGIAPRTVYDDLVVAKGRLLRALNRG